MDARVVQPPIPEERPADAPDIPEAKSENPASSVPRAEEKLADIARRAQPYGHFDDSLGEAVRKLLTAMSQPAPEVRRGSQATRFSINAQQLADFANACDDFEECDDDIGEAIRGLYNACDRILMPS